MASVLTSGELPRTVDVLPESAHRRRPPRRTVQGLPFTESSNTQHRRPSSHRSSSRQVRSAHANYSTMSAKAGLTSASLCPVCSPLKLPLSCVDGSSTAANDDAVTHPAVRAPSRLPACQADGEVHRATCSRGVPDAHPSAWTEAVPGGRPASPSPSPATTATAKPSSTNCAGSDRWRAVRRGRSRRSRRSSPRRRG
jgi:hypothetical protein